MKTTLKRYEWHAAKNQNHFQPQYFAAIYDKGYHIGSEFEYVNRLGVEVLVAIPSVSAYVPATAFVNILDTTKL